MQLSKAVQAAYFQSVLHQVGQAFGEVGHMLGHCELGANASTGPSCELWAVFVPKPKNIAKLFFILLLSGQQQSQPLASTHNLA